MTGIELIAQKRQEQIEKHGWDAEHDKSHSDREIVTFTLYVLTLQEKYVQYGWGESENKVFEKKYKERLIIAGALIAAEIDRLNYIERDKK